MIETRISVTHSKDGDLKILIFIRSPYSFLRGPITKMKTNILVGPVAIGKGLLVFS